MDFVKLDTQRKNYLQQLSTYTSRNVITYYSGWMSKRNAEDVSINDKDINAFMDTVYKLDKSKGLDLILHTPGGDIAATEQIINYLHSIFNNDIRAIIPQMAMSAGSLISVSCKEIIMGKQSCLGPFDPQMGGVACQSVIKEFEDAKEDIKNNPQSLGLWQVIVSKYHPTFLLACKQAVLLTNELANKVLKRSVANKAVRGKIKKLFNDNSISKLHSRHYSKEKVKKAGLNVIDLESDPKLQDLVLSLHHSYIITLEHSLITKIVENQIGSTYIRALPIPQEVQQKNITKQ
ncbi:MAG: ATP-dependent Clp protease proteolytic subunit [Bacteroidales bacterium]|nr:ATP-dependent Clp protease proteolytic subunit [Bacteroidales bacterium]